MIIIQDSVFSQPWFIVLIVLASIAFVVGSVFLGFFIARNRMRHQVKDLETQYNNIHDTFSSDCSNMIKRIEVISSHNDSYVQIFNSMQDRFGTLLNNNDKSCFCSVDSLKKLIRDKDYRSLPSIIESTRKSMAEFKKEADILNGDLQSILKQEEECRSESIALKEKFRNLKNYYETNKTALLSLEGSFNKLFDHIMNLFAKFESLLEEANYPEASAVLPEIEKLLDACSSVIEEIPFLNTLVDKVIPNKINDLSLAYQPMEGEYPLHHLLVKTRIEEMNQTVKDCKKSLQMMSIVGVKDKLNKISFDISKFFADFEKEKACKEEFDKNQPGISSSSYEAEKQFANLTNSLPNYQKVYKINQTYIDQMSVIKDMIDDMSTNKRRLDMFLNSSTKQPYSVLLNTLNDLKSRIAKIQNAFDDFHSYLKGLKRDSERSYSYVREAFVELKKLECIIRRINLDSLNSIYLPRMQNAYVMIKEIDDILKVVPIDVVYLNSKYEETRNVINQLKAELIDLDNKAIQAEQAIVYDNTIRSTSPEIAKSIKKAERAFLESDFSRAASTALFIYKEWNQAK